MVSHFKGNGTLGPWTGRGHEDDEDRQEGCSTTANASLIWIDLRLTGIAGPDYDAAISFGLPFEPEDCQYGKSRLSCIILAMAIAMYTTAVLTLARERHSLAIQGSSTRYFEWVCSPQDSQIPCPRCPWYIVDLLILRYAGTSLSVINGSISVTSIRSAKRKDPALQSSARGLKVLDVLQGLRLALKPVGSQPIQL